MQVETINIQDIKPYEKNAKKHPDEQVTFIANSIEKFGFQQPIVVDKDNVIIIGHGRFLAAQKLGMTEVPVIHATGLTKKQVQALRIADNKTNEKGSWDEKLLGEELKELLDDMSMTDFGFGDFELEILTGDFKPEPFDDDLEEYAQNDTKFTAKRRVIITYKDEDEEKVKNLLGVEEVAKVVYDITEIAP